MDATVDQKHYKAAQEIVRNDLERAFGVLLSRFQILRNAVRYWKRKDVVLLSEVCVILHNMIIRTQ